MSHLAGRGWKSLHPLAEVHEATWLSPDGCVAWMAWEPREVEAGWPVLTRSRLDRGRIRHRLGQPSSTPRPLAGLVLPLLREICSGQPGWVDFGGSLPQPRPWRWGAERPRSRLLSDPAPGGAGLEIGFGNGDHLVAASQAADWWGVEESRHSVDSLVRKDPPQATVVHGAAQLLLPHLPTAAFEAVVALFPDPWPKKRHHRRRWLGAASLAQVARILASGGLFGIATDHPGLAAHLEEALTTAPGLRPAPGRTGELGLAGSKYAARAEAAGWPVRVWTFSRSADPAPGAALPLPTPPWEVGPPPARPARRGCMVRTADGIVKVVDAASGPLGLLLHLMHVDPDGNDQSFVLCHGPEGWLWDPLTAPLVTTELLAAVRDLALALAR